MSFPVHNFEVHHNEKISSFAFHETIQEGQELYFLGSFDSKIISDPTQAAEELFGWIVDHIKTSKISNPYDRFEEALKVANLNAKKWFSDDSKKPDMVIAYFDFNQLHLTQAGQAESYLVRDNSVSQISEASEQEEDLFLNILSGEVSVNDTILLSSSRLLRFVTTNQVVGFFGKENFNQSCHQLQEELEQQSPEPISVTCIGVGKKDKGGGSSGFLARIVAKGEAMVSTKKGAKAKAPDPEPEAEEITEDPLAGHGGVVEKDSSTEEKEDDKPKAAAPVAKKSGGLKVPKVPFEIPKGAQAKKILIIAGAVLAIFLLFIVFKAISGFQSPQEKEHSISLQIAREALHQADSLLLQGERKQAQEFLEKALKETQKVAQSKTKTFRSDVGIILSQIEEKQLQVENARKVTPNLVTDLSLKNDNLEANGLLSLRGNLYVNDSKSVYKTVSNIVEKGVPLSEKETIIAQSGREDQNTLLYLSDAPRIIEYKEGVISPMSTSDESWKSGVDIRTYGRYAYVLDPAENQIWKYERRRANYSAAAAYNTGADLSRGVSIAIDGAIYILTDDGNIKKLFRGQPVDYDFREIPSTPFEGKQLKLFTSAELDFIYVLDPENQRVLVFVKGDRYATYKKQVMYGIEDARDFVVDESGQKVFLLTKDKIYTFAL